MRICNTRFVKKGMVTFLKRRNKALAVLLIAIAVVGIGGYFAYDYISVKVADEVLKNTIKNQLKEKVETGDISIDALQQPIVNHEEKENLAENTDVDEVIISDNSGSFEDTLQKEDVGEQSPSVEHTEISEKEQNEEKTPVNHNQPEVKVTTEQIIEQKVDQIVESISEKTKKELIAMITSKLTSSEISYFLSMLSGGLSAEEKIEGKKFVYSRFNSEEIATIQALYDKYIDELDAEKLSD